MKGRKPKKDAVRRGGHVTATVELVAEVVPAGALDKTGVLTAQDCLNRVPSATEKAVNEHDAELADAGQNATV